MKTIALTSANEPAMEAVAHQLLAASMAQDKPLHVILGVDTAFQAQVVYSGGGEIWRIGQDDSRPELDALIDRAIDDSAPARMAHEVDQALHRFLNKKAIAA
jgi:hypothetical protein